MPSVTSDVEDKSGPEAKVLYTARSPVMISLGVGSPWELTVQASEPGCGGPLFPYATLPPVGQGLQYIPGAQCHGYLQS